MSNTWICMFHNRYSTCVQHFVSSMCMATVISLHVWKIICITRNKTQRLQFLRLKPSLRSGSKLHTRCDLCVSSLVMQYTNAWLGSKGNDFIRVISALASLGHLTSRSCNHCLSPLLTQYTILKLRMHSTAVQMKMSISAEEPTLHWKRKTDTMCISFILF